MRANKICAEPGCPKVCRPAERRCDVHRLSAAGTSGWDSKRGTTPRTSRTGHKARRVRILKRDPECQLQLPGCTGTSSVCDHRVPLGAAIVVGLTEAQLDTDDNCQGACDACSRRKSSQEGHYLRGDNVECPWHPEDVERLRRLPSGPDASSRIPRRIDTASPATDSGYLPPQPGDGWS